MVTWHGTKRAASQISRGILLLLLRLFWPTGPAPSVRRRHLKWLLFIPHRADTFISIALPFVGGNSLHFYLKNLIQLNSIKSHRDDLVYSR